MRREICCNKRDNIQFDDERRERVREKRDKKKESRDKKREPKIRGTLSLRREREKDGK